MNKITRYIRTSTRLQALVLFSLFPSLVFLPSNMQANPSGGVVMGGAAEIGEGLNGHLQIMQHSNRAVIDWAQFSIAAGELTQFIQPGADAAVLNRVTSGSPSAIMGALQANGNVAVINTAGILVGPTGTIDVNGLMLSTLDVSNADFMGGGDMIFRGATAAGVTNMGRINAVGGDVFLLGKTVVNTGAISAANGTVGLAAGEEVLITAVANPAGERVFVRPTAGVKSGTGVDNSGTIEGAMVELKAHGNMYALAINNSGSIRATGATTNGGKVTLRAIGGTITNTGSIAATLPSGTGGRIIIDAGVGGTVNAGGKIDASAKGKGQIGGVVMISGESVTVPGGADISANGDGGGGFIQIGSGDGVDAMNVAVEAGSKISANGVSGPGGMVVIQGGADSNVMVAGSVSANSESGAGGIIIVEGGDVAVTQTSTLEANGATGGLITVTGENSAVVNGTLNAVGSAGDGGMINISGGNSTLVGSTANINAGGSVNGGWVKITSGGETTMGGTVNSVGGSGIGGKVDTVGAAVELAASARIDASGLAGGGRVRIGGSLQGRHPTLMNATTTTVQSGARIVADATGNGDGGTVIVWADEDTIYRGDISARGAGVGRGGFVEVSGKESLFFDGEVDTLAADGSAGILLLDPRNMTISGAANSANNINDGTLEGLVVANNVVVSTFSGDAEAGNITVTGQVRYNSGNSLTLLAEHDIYVANDIINQGAGNVNLVAGWDSGNLSLATLLGGAPTSPGSTFGDVNMDASFFDTAFYGVDNGFGNGSVYIGTSDAGITGANTNVVVGSRTGQTNVAGYDVNVWGGVTTTGENRYSQIGYDREEAGTANALAPSGRIRVQSVNDVSIIGGYSNQGGPGDVGGVGRYSYGHIGHGGDWGSARQAMSGDIIVEAGRDVTGQAGQNRQNFVMIGHGGVYGDDVNNTGVIGGNITVTAGRNVDFRAGVGYRSFAMVGHGGASVRPTDMTKSDINVTAGGDVIFHAGTGALNINGRESFAQLGHGGYDSDTLNVGSGQKGDISVIAGGKIEFLAGDMRDNYVQLGSGGRGTTSGRGANQGIGISGNIDVQAGTGISFIAGTFSNRATTNVNQDGVTPSDPNDDGRMYAMLGHGGYDADATGSNTYVAGVGHSGDISVLTTTGDISFMGGGTSNGSTGDNEGRILFALLGHGGVVSSGDHTGSIDVEATAGSINFKAGDAIDNSSDQFHYAQLGHGGQASSWGFGGGDPRGNMSAASVSGGTDGIRVTAGNAVNFTGGDRLGTHPAGSSTNSNQNNNQNYAQLGLGGYDTDGNHSGSITVNAGAGGVNFSAGGGSLNYAMLGNGGYSATGNTTGDIVVNGGAGGVNFTGGTGGPGTSSFALLGNGGQSNRGDHSGNITVTSGVGGVNFIVGASNTNWVQIGHGGWDADATTGHSGNISVTANGGGNIIFDARSADPADQDANDTYAQIGHGGRSNNGNHFGTIDVITNGGGDINFTGGDYRSYAQLGHGGRDSLGNMGQDTSSPDDESISKITVNSSGGINFAAGGMVDGWAGREAYVQLGHGGAYARGDHIGEIDVTAVGSIVFTASHLDGSDEGSYRGYAQLGHGGYDADNPNPGDDAGVINDANNSFINAGQTYAFDGYGFVAADAYGPARFGPTAAQRLGNRGDIRVESIDGAVVFTAGDESESYAQIGHGGANTDGDHSGNITVLADVDRSHAGILLGENYNHNDNLDTGLGYNGDPNARVANPLGGGQYYAGDILFDARSENEGGTMYAQLGHGGYYASGGHDGDIVVQAGEDITFRAGRDTGGYAQVGHGGANNHNLNFSRVDGSAPGNFSDNDYDDRVDSVGVVNPGTGDIGDFQPDDGNSNGNDRYYSGTHKGDIDVKSFGDVQFIGFTTEANMNGGYVKIGHGGWQNDADPFSPNGAGHNGDITVHAGGLTIAGGQITGAQNANASITFESGMQSNSFAHLGHGGYESFGNHFGDIEVAAANHVDFHARGGADATASGGQTTAQWNQGHKAENSWVQVGHGGRNSSYEAAIARMIESTTLAANATIGAVLNEGGAGANSWFYLNATSLANLGSTNWGGPVIGSGVAADGSGLPMYGQGSLQPLTTFNQTFVNASTIRFVDHDNNPLTDPLPIIIPESRGRWFHIATPAAPRDAGGNPIIGMSGDINVMALNGDTIFQAAGNENTPGAPTVAPLPGGPTSGNGLGPHGARYSYMQVGHGGYESGGDHTGDITIRSQGGEFYLQAARAFGNDDPSAEWHQGMVYAYAQVGHGGARSGGDMSGDITIVAADTARMIAGAGEQTYVQVGHGGYDANVFSGAGSMHEPDTRVGNVSGNTDRRGAHLQNWYNPAYDILTNSVGGYIRTDVARLDNGVPDINGRVNDPSLYQTVTGDITIVAGNGVEVKATDQGTSSGNNSYASVGHGGAFTQGNNSGSIVVDASGQDPTDGNTIIGTGGAISFLAGLSGTSYTQLGHGGRDADGSHWGTIDVTSGNGGDITFTSGRNDNYAQLGHGGRDNNGNHGDSGVLVGGNLDTAASKITVISDGGIAFGSTQANNEWGQSNFTYAQLGHGGYGARGDQVGDIEVTAVGDIQFTGGTGFGSYVQLGNGGYESENPNNTAGRGPVGTIDVTTTGGGNIEFTAGGNGPNGRRSYAQIGHGGWDVHGNLGEDPNRPGDATVSAITVTSSGGITLQGGQGSSGGGNLEGFESYVMVGHGGQSSRGDHVGDIVVTAEGNILLRGGTEASSTRNSVTIGHGGYDADNGNSTTIGNRGDITVQSNSGEVRLVGGAGSDSAVLIGHGGRSTHGGNSGDIIVTAGTDIFLIGSSTGVRSYAQIGHGGYDADGNHSGFIKVDAGGDIELTGGPVDRAYAMIGHGDQSDSGGTRTGDIFVGAGGEISMDPSTGQAIIGHRRNNGAAIISNLTIAARSLDETVGDSGSNILTIDSARGNWLQTMLAYGDVSLYGRGTGGLWMNSTDNMVYDSVNDFNMLSSYDIYFSNDVLNRGAGDINVIAGYDPTVGLLADPLTCIIAGVDMDANIFGVAGSYGINDGSVYVGSAGAPGTGANTGVAVGSRIGDTNVVGYDVNVWSSPLGPTGTGRNYSMIGYERTAGGTSGALAISGGIHVQAENDVSIISNRFAVGSEGYTGWNNSPSAGAGNLGYSAFAQIGHGGREALRTSNMSGDITVEAGRDVTAQGGHSRENYVMIGHGGFDNKQGLAPPVSPSTTPESTAVIGLGNITVVAGRDVDFRAGIGAIAFAQIGHGGVQHVLADFTASDIDVTAGRDIIFHGGLGGPGDAYQGYAQLGHGGYDADLTNAAEAGGGGYSGNITVRASGKIEFIGGVDSVNYAQLGNGGWATAGHHSGTIDVVAGTDLILTSGANNTDRAAILGHGSANNTATSVAGNVIARAGRDMTLTSAYLGSVGNTYTSGDTLIGVGHILTANDASRFNSAATGELRVYIGPLIGAADAVSTNALFNGTAHGATAFANDFGPATWGTGNYWPTVPSNNNVGGNFGYYQLAWDGLYNYIINGAEAAAIAADVVTPIGGLGGVTISPELGQLTYGALPDFDGGTQFITVNSAINFTSANYLTFRTTGDITFNASVQNSGSGNVNVAAGWDLLTDVYPAGDFTAGFLSIPSPGTPSVNSNFASILAALGSWGNNNGLVTIGDGLQTAGISVGSASGQTNVLGYGVSLASGATTDDLTMIGYYGAGSGDIDVRAKDGGVSLTAGTANDSFAKIGHGMRRSNNVTGSGDIAVSTTGSVSLAGGSAQDTYAQVGHGGILNTSNQGLAGDTTVVTAGTGVLLQSGLGDNAYTLIGNGGVASSATMRSDITVTTTAGDIVLNGGLGVGPEDDQFAQIGNSATQSAGSTRGNITVEALAGKVSLNAGAGGAGVTPGYVQIGNGGYEADGSYNGDASETIEVNAALIELIGGGALAPGAYAQIGNGGYDADANAAGSINVDSGGTITLTSGASDDAYVQIGHGGRLANGNFAGDICVHADGGIILDAATGGGLRSYAQIGHGGSGATSTTMAGNVIVTSSADGIELIGGDDTGEYAQIGHGGANTSGSMTGNIYAIAEGVDSGDITLTGGSGLQQYAQIGHGDAGGTSSGTRGGGLHIFAEDDLTATNGGGTNNVSVLHQSGGGLTAANMLNGGDGFQIVANGTTTLPQSALNGVGSMIGGNMASGLVNFATAYDMDIVVDSAPGGLGFNGTTSNDFYILTGGSLTMIRGYRNAGDGDVTLVAGWDGSGFSRSGLVTFTGGDFCQPVITESGSLGLLFTCDSFGNDPGSVNGVGTLTIGSTAQTAGVSIGSRLGQNTFAGAAISLFGSNSTSNAHSQLGFRPGAGGQSATGDIELHVKSGGLLLDGGSASGSYAQVGHGGYGSVANSHDADINVIFCEVGDVTFTAGGTNSYAQLGHGARDRAGNMAGDINIIGDNSAVSAGNVTLTGNGSAAHAQIGHGGHNQDGTHTGDIMVDASAGAVLIDAGGGSYSYASIGHGGSFSQGTNDGDITVLGTSITALGGTGYFASAQVGHGGREASGNHTGNITVDVGTGDAIFTAGSGSDYIYVQLGHGSGYRAKGNHTGDIQLNAGSVAFTAGSTDQSMAQIGHGGYDSDGSHSGEITVDATVGGITFSGGSDRNTFAQIGHGGRASGGTLNGDITVNSADDILFSAGTGQGAYTQIGHGGYDSIGAKTGDIHVETSNGKIQFLGGLGGSPTGGSVAYAQLGHGGYNGDGNHAGDITVIATEDGSGEGIIFEGGDQSVSYVQLGHGGYGARSGSGGVSFGLNGDINVSSVGDIRFMAGTLGAAQFTTSGNIYAQLGHGGYDADVNSSGTGQYSGVGHNGDITVVATHGSISFLGGDPNRAVNPSNGVGIGSNHYAQLGHGGRSSNGDHFGDITVRAGIEADGTINDGSKDILFSAGGQATGAWADTNSYAQLGHGGRYSEGNMGRADEVISVMSARDITFTADPGGSNHYAQLGNGGSRARGDHQGNIDVFAERNILFEGSQNVNGSGTFTADYAFGGSATSTWNATLNQDRAANLGDGGNVGLSFNRPLSGTMVVTIRLDDGTIVGTLSDALTPGVLVADGDLTADFGTGVETITAGTAVGTVTYGNSGTLTFTRDVNPGMNGGTDAQNTILGDIGTTNVWIAFQHDDADASYAQLGHGGYDADNTATAVGNQGSINIVARTGSITFQGGNDDGTYSQLGHGGYVTAGANTGTIDVTAGQGISLLGGSGSYSSSQFGHGNSFADGNHTGAITITSGSDILLTSGSGTRASTQIGHGGYDADGSNTGTITIVSGGSVNATGGSGGQTQAQIGHGGWRADGSHTGDISVTANTGAAGLTFTAGSGAQAMAQIGHGGYESDGNHSGNILVLGGTGGISFTASTLGYFAHAMIGHGGRDAGLSGPGDKAGDITVTSAGGGITFTAGGVNGSSRHAHAQIGHGGYGNAVIGNYDGDIAVTANGGGAVTFNGGGNYGSYAMLGHGGFGSGTGIDGNMTGDIAVTADGDVAFTAGTQGYTFAILGHGGRDNDGTKGGAGATIDVTSNTGSVLFAAGTGIGGDRAFAQLGHGGAGSTGAATADITVNALLGAVDFSGGNRTYNYAQLGHGGYNGDGAHTGSITVNAGAAGIDFSAGSGSNSFVQLGHGGRVADGVQGGDISVVSGGAILFSAGSGGASSAKLGHGGDEAGGDKSGAITVDAQGGNIEFRAGSADRAWAQLGHGSTNDAGTSTGDIAVTADGDVAFTAGTQGYTFAILGHGGRNNDGTKGGAGATIDVTSNTGSVTFAAGTGIGGDRAFAQLGHGGADSTGAATADITVNALQGAVNFSGGNRSINYAQLGHGGYNGDGAHTGSITVNAGAAGIDFSAGSGSNSFVQLGHGGRVADGVQGGDISVVSGGAILFSAGSGGASSAKLGHGGDEAGGDKSGAITVDAQGGNIEFRAGSADRAWAQLGHGSTNDAGTSTGDIDVDATGDVIFATGSGGGGNWKYAQLGHGGYNNDGSHNGAIDVNSGGAITFSSAGVAGSYGFTQLGHGGAQSGGSLSGIIGAQAIGAITFTAGDAAQSYSQLGHGGYNSDGTKTGAITVSGSSVGLTGGTGSAAAFAQIGHGGATTSGAITNAQINVDVTGAIDLDAGSGGNAYAQIGHGGYDTLATTVTAADILINTAAGMGAGDVTLDGSGVNSYAQIGHGGARPDSNANFGAKSGAITIDKAANISVRAGANTDGYAQIGHGGEGGNGGGTAAALAGAITLNSAGDLTVSGGGGEDTYAQVGHGGDMSQGDTSGNITVTTLGKVDMDGGSNADAYAQIGHGGSGNNHNHGLAGDTTTVNAGTGLEGNGGSASRTFVQIGNGGYNSDGVRNGDIAVTSGGGIAFIGGTGIQSTVKIGHGGDDSSGNSSGAITVDAQGGNIEFRAGTQDRAFAQLGHGSLNAVGTASGDIDVTASGNVMFASGGGFNNWKYAQLGHGGYNSDGSHNGDIKLVAGGNIDFDSTAAAGVAGYTQFGHGGERADGNHSGLVSARAGGTINFTAGGGADAYSQFGHGGRSARGDHSGRLEMLGTSIAFTGGAGDRAYAQFGHGGHDADTGGAASVGNTGDISLAATTGNISFSGGVGTDTYSQLGHGGAYTEGANSGNIVARSGGDFLVTPGTGTGAYAQVGHGGTSASGTAGHTGSVTVTAGTFDPDLQFNGVVANRDYIDVFDVNGDGTIDGADVVNITNNTTVGVRVGAATPGGAAGAGAYSQIGHGGLNAHGNHGAGPISDGVRVESTAGLYVYGGGSDDASAQIGHGGQNVIGNLNSRIYTASEGDLTVQGGTGARSYAQIGLGGHDDVAGAGDIEGDKNGMIVVFSRLGDINVTGGTTAGAYGQVGHGGLNNDGNFLHENLGLFVQSGWNTTPVAGPPAGDLTVTSNVGYGMIGSGDAIPAGTGDRVGLVFTSSTGNTNDFGQIGHMTAAGIRSARSGSVNLTAGDYTIGTTGTYRETGAEVVARVLAADYMVGAGGSIFINEDVTFASGNTLSLAARDNIYVYASIQNSQAVDGGDVNLFAGWDGVTGLGKAPFIYVNVPPAGLSFDPALVIADPASYGIGDGITQGLIQFGDGTQTNAIGVGSRSGATRVLGHTLDMNAGTAAGAHAQIGFHIISATGNSASGDITVAMTGDISMDGGSQDGAYVQIGHGALYVTGTSLAGDISVTTTTGGVTVNGGTALDTFGMIGHGGVFTRANKSGSILVQAGGGDVALTSGGGERAFTQIGHGGVGSGGTATLGLAGDLIDVIAFNDIIIRASDTGLRAYSQIGNGGFDSDAPTLAGNVRVVALNDLTVTGGGADQAFAQIGNGGGSTDGNKEGIIIVSAGDGLLAGNVTLTRGAGSDSFAKIGHGDQAFTTGAGGAGGDSGAGTIDGDIQVTAGESVVSTGGMIGHVDTSLGGPAVANSGSTFIAVSRNDFPATMATGDGTLTADATSVFASAPGGELRFYLPRRDSNLIAPGALLNGTPYGGAPVDPAFQLPTEFAAGPDQLAFGQHTNLNTAAANAAGLVLNLDPIDAASYGGAFSFYYDNIDVNVPPPAPPAPPAPPVPPAPPIFVTIDGQLFFNQNVLAPGSPFVQAGPFSTVFTDDYFNSDNQRYDLQIFDAGDKKGWYRAVGAWTSSFDTIYSTVEGGPAWSSFTEFGDGSRPTSGYSEYFNSLNSQSEQDDELRSLLENLEAELAELRGLGDSSE